MSEEEYQSIYGTPEPVKLEEQVSIEELRKERDAKIAGQVAEDKQESNSEPTQQTSSTGDTESKPREDAGKDDEYYGEIDPEEQTSLFDKGNDGGDWARGLSEAAVLPGVAALDFGVDAINLIPGVNFKKINRKKKRDCLYK